MNNKLQGKDLINIGILRQSILLSFCSGIHRVYPDLHPTHQCDRPAGRRHPHDAVFL